MRMGGGKEQFMLRLLLLSSGGRRVGTVAQGGTKNEGHLSYSPSLDLD